MRRTKPAKVAIGATATLPLIMFLALSGCSDPKVPTPADIPLGLSSTGPITGSAVSAEAVRACEAFRQKRGQLRLDECERVRRLLPATLGSAQLLELLGEPDQRTTDSAQYSLGYANGVSHTMHVRIWPYGNACIFGIGGGG
jgi:hypothetical protein